MKIKNLILVVSLTAFYCCTSEDIPTTMETEMHEEKANNSIYYRSFDEAKEIAENSINMLDNSNMTTRGVSNTRKLNLKTGVKAICKPTIGTRGAETNPDTLLYIFNFEDNNGFSIVSASRETEGLIAVAESGSYDPDVPTGNPGFDTYMEMAKAYIIHEDQEASLSRNNTRSSEYPIMCRPQYDTVFNKQVSPMVSVRWGQNGRMGQYFSNLHSGCVTTALAQVMSHYKYPNTLSLTYNNRDTNSTSLDWQSICNHTYTYVYNNRDAADYQIGRMARQLAEIAGFSCVGNETRISKENGKRAIQSLGYQTSSFIDYGMVDSPADIESGYSMANGLAAGRIVCMFGFNNSNVGHAWIIDGCYYIKAIYRLMATNDGTTWYVYQEGGTYRTCHNHINWGWDGDQNGYYLGTVLNACDILEHDDNTGSIGSVTGRNFYRNVKYFFAWH